MLSTARHNSAFAMLGLSGIASILVFASTAAAASLPSGYAYVSPSPGSRYVLPTNNVVVRAERDLDLSDVARVAFTVTGSRSGIHTGAVRLSDDSRTLVFVPDRPFEFAERVTVAVEPGPVAPDRLDFDFAVATAAAPRRMPGGIHEDELDAEEGNDRRLAPLQSAPIVPPPSMLAGPLPTGYPPIYLLVSNNADPGRVFMTPNPPGAPAQGNLVIMDNRGQPIFYRRHADRVSDFWMQSNGRLTYFDEARTKYYALDSAYVVVDSFATGNGYETDSHDLRLLPNGHALLMSYDPQPVRMDSVVAGGDPNAIVTGLIIQQIDASKNVVFQWRSWDHFLITDAVACVVNLLAPTVDYCHGNALDLDLDGNLLVSSRHMNEITKINRATGATIWRFGLNATHNQFTVMGDSRGFSHQHDVRRLANGHLSVFDNGNCLSPEYSRGLEFALDEVNKVATLVWSYRHSPDLFGRATGNSQRRAGGGTMINWGFAPYVTDLRPDGGTGLELTFLMNNMRTYRALRFPWNTSRFAVDPGSLEFGSVPLGSYSARNLAVRNRTSSPLEIDYFQSSDSLTFRVLDPVPIVIGPNATSTVQVLFQPHHPGDWKATLYPRAMNDSELVAQSADLHGTATGTADASGDGSGSLQLAVSPSPASGTTRVSFTVARAGPVRISVLDPQGRVVAMLAERAFEVGRHEVRWNPAAETAPGLYFVRCQSVGVEQIGKVVRVR